MDNGYGNFAIGLDPIFFHELHIQLRIRKFKIMFCDIQSNSETAYSVAHEPKYLVVSILPHEAKVVASLPFVREIG